MHAKLLKRNISGVVEKEPIARLSFALAGWVGRFSEVELTSLVRKEGGVANAIKAGGLFRCWSAPEDRGCAMKHGRRVVMRTLDSRKNSSARPARRFFDKGKRNPRGCGLERRHGGGRLYGSLFGY